MDLAGGRTLFDLIDGSSALWISSLAAILYSGILPPISELNLCSWSVIFSLIYQGELHTPSLEWQHELTPARTRT